MQRLHPLTRLLWLLRHAVAVFMARQTPWHIKVLLVAGILYLLSPYDLIPEWVPVIGVLDDMALAALLLAWVATFQVPDK